MNKFLKYACLILLSAALLTSCRKSNGAEQNVMMVARVYAVGERIEVEVLESEYTSGPHWVLTNPQTEYRGADGSRLSRDGISAGDTVEIYYNGQVMLSYPPQIVAHKIVKR